MISQIPEKCQKLSPDQTRLAAKFEQNMPWSNYNAEVLLFPKLTGEQAQNFCYGKQNLLN